MDHVGNPDGKLFCSVLGPLQTVQRAELWGVILALQACTSAHMSDDNPDVIRHVGRLLEAPSARMESRVERHIDDEMVRLGTVKQVDEDDGDCTDGAADQGGRCAGAHIMDVRRMLSQTCHFWYLVLNHLHGFLSSLLPVLSSMMIARREKSS